MTSSVPQSLLDAPLSRERGPASLQRQLHDRLKQAILGAHLAPGSRLPGSRALAEALAISRNTVTTVYDLLAAEGYLLPDRQGTRVAALTRLAPIRTPHGATQRVATQRSAAPPVARRLSAIRVEPVRPDGDVALRPGVPALAQFPLAEWRRALDRVMRGTGPSVLGYGDPFGEPALRHAIARHLSVARGVRCTAAQVVVTEGAMEALALCARLLANPGDTAWVEDPGYRGARTAMHAADLQIVPMRVDAEGLCVRDADWAARPPRLIYATPSHQYPSGAVMSAARRLELIANAQRHGAWIIEDDYDSEFRHAGEPIGAMQGLVAQAPVLYVGTFSKTMFPSLRLGFLVLPEALAARLRAPLEQLLRGGHRHEQLALAGFIESGAFGRHLGRMRRLYRQRQAALREALSRHLRVPHAIDGGHCGLHLTVRLPGRYPDAGIAAEALHHGMAPAALSSFAMQASADDNGLVLGYGNTPAERFEPLVKRLSQLARAAG
ncbi:MULTISPECIES: PLP-dependent aminotransferase family protein [unclassified Rhizobacter]|uniref:MocR-like pyridoxine biosynthesis transcription factor PdxR n=1 Tax=unclassified Rhizobacter TaxID=2640088 RepID=UPI0006F7933C|nr:MULTISPECIES: PLP-dependent aminotransferase family protein [unclassified Rhizobacter]KQU80810.1 DNA-binding protein [Rhizobacter sp. Root29]KQW04353.1 DNA-binding protein [Rhizobacter sp. Root1238]KRB14515.1 DNA-binding protein [Rhizobacter sp. Root16D2]